MSGIARTLTSHKSSSVAKQGENARQISPTFTRAMDWSDIRHLAGSTKFIILVSALGNGGVSQEQTTGSEFHMDSSVPMTVLGTLTEPEPQSGKSHHSDDVMIGHLKVNFSTMEANRGGEPLSLTALEFKTLRYLINNPHRVISRDELLNEVWGYNNYPSTRTVDNQVVKLRKKMEHDPARPVHLRTVHGTGYKFIP